MSSSPTGLMSTNLHSGLPSPASRPMSNHIEAIRGTCAPPEPSYSWIKEPNEGREKTRPNARPTLREKVTKASALGPCRLGIHFLSFPQLEIAQEKKTRPLTWLN